MHTRFIYPKSGICLRAFAKMPNEFTADDFRRVCGQDIRMNNLDKAACRDVLQSYKRKGWIETIGKTNTWRKVE